LDESEGSRFLLGHPQRLIVNWCFGAAPMNPLVGAVLRKIEANFFLDGFKFHEDVKSAIWQATGPFAFYEGLLDGIKQNKEMSVEFRGIDFYCDVWPKFKSSNFMYSMSSHYTEARNRPIFRRVD
jgi:hypothetical protein